MNRADLQLWPHPPRHVHIGPGLDGDIVLDAKKIQRSGEGHVVRAFRLVTDARPELSQCEGHERRAAKHGAQGAEYRGFQPSDTPDPQVHPAPPGVHTGRHVVPVDVPAQDALDHHCPEQAGEGQREAEQVQHAADANERPDVRAHEDVANLAEGHEAQEADQQWGVQHQQEQELQGGEMSDGEHQCCCLIALRAASARLGGGRDDLAGLLKLLRALSHLSHCVATTEERPDRYRPSCGPQSLRQLRDEDRVPAMVGEGIVPSQCGAKQITAD